MNENFLLSSRKVSRVGIVLASPLLSLAASSVASAAVIGDPGYTQSDFTTEPSFDQVNETVVEPTISEEFNLIIIRSFSNNPASATVSAAGDGNFSFNWSVSALDTESASISINESTTVLNTAANGNSGTFPLRQPPNSIFLNQGDEIRFDFVDANPGGGSFQINVFNAPDAPAAIPTPAMLPGLIGMGVAFMRKKLKSQEEAVATEQEAPVEVEV